LLLRPHVFHAKLNLSSYLLLPLTKVSLKPPITADEYFYTCWHPVHNVRQYRSTLVLEERLSAVNSEGVKPGAKATGKDETLHCAIL